MNALQSIHDALEIKSDAIIATVGGGGKTTLLFAIAQEHANYYGERKISHNLAILTTTTKFTIPSNAKNLPLVLGTNLISRASAIQDAWKRNHHAIVVGSSRGERGRILAVEPGWPTQALELPQVSLICVEADGAAGRGFKAPANHEPVLPINTTHVLACVSLAVLGKPINDKNVHRPEHVASITGSNLGDPITAEMIATVLAHKQGGRKSISEKTIFTAVITNATQNSNESRIVANACHDAGIDNVLAFNTKPFIAMKL